MRGGRPLSLTIASIFVLLAAKGSAAPTLLDFDYKGPKVIWFDRHLPDSIPDNSIRALGTQVSIDPDGHAGDILLVINETSGNGLSTAVSRLMDAGRKYTDDDFGFVGRVRVSCTGNGGPLTSGTVELTSSGRTQKKTLTVADKGVAEFLFVSPGNCTVTVRGDSSAPVTKSFPLSLERADPIPEWKMSLTGAAGDDGAGGSSFPTGMVATAAVVVIAGAAAMAARKRS